MKYDGSSVQSASVSRPKGLLGALDQLDVCWCLMASFTRSGLVLLAKY